MEALLEDIKGQRAAADLQLAAARYDSGLAAHGRMYAGPAYLTYTYIVGQQQIHCSRRCTCLHMLATGWLPCSWRAVKLLTRPLC